MEVLQPQQRPSASVIVFRDWAEYTRRQPDPTVLPSDYPEDARPLTCDKCF